MNSGAAEIPSAPAATKLRRTSLLRYVLARGMAGFAVQMAASPGWGWHCRHGMAVN